MLIALVGRALTSFTCLFVHGYVRPQLRHRRALLRRARFSKLWHVDPVVWAHRLSCPSACGTQELSLCPLHCSCRDLRMVTSHGTAHAHQAHLSSLGWQSSAGCSLVGALSKEDIRHPCTAFVTPLSVLISKRKVKKVSLR